MTVARWLAAAGGIVTLLAGCATEPAVQTQSAQHLEQPAPSTSTAGTAPPGTLAPATTTPATLAPATSPPVTEPPPPTDAPVLGPLGDAIDVGDAKAPRDYDDFVRLALSDIQQWWSEQYPSVYGAPFDPLAGGVYAAYPERTTPIPGCETDAPTPYEEIIQYSAFYCMDGDFMVYDDGPDGVLYQLAVEFGESILGVVLAHEFGHAIQARAGVLDEDLPTIATEQQADCFAGAWVAHAASGASRGFEFDDADVRNGLVAMITVRDPIGIDQFDHGGHGSAFDRVGAFQTGFVDGPARCAQLIDDPLPLVPNVFQPGAGGDGNSAFGYGDGEVLSFIPRDLQEYWDAELAARGATMPTLTLVPVAGAEEVRCEQPAGSFATGAVWCPATQEVFFDEPLARDLYGRFGDFVVGYIVGGAWSDAAQAALGSTLEGEARFLVDDCLTGAWAATSIPGPGGTTPRGTVVEPGDLDEAIQAALVVGDDSSGDDVVGSGFEKIASFREGVIDGIDACAARITE